MCVHISDMNAYINMKYCNVCNIIISVIWIIKEIVLINIYKIEVLQVHELINSNKIQNIPVLMLVSVC